MNYLISKRICSTKVYLDSYVSTNYETKDIDPTLLRIAFSCFSLN